jgi:hypothetical protein
MPDVLIDWIRTALGLVFGQWVDYNMCGQECWGDGFTDGVSNRTTVYMVRNIKEEDATAFRIQFPECKLFVCEQYAY